MLKKSQMRSEGTNLMLTISSCKLSFMKKTILKTKFIFASNSKPKILPKCLRVSQILKKLEKLQSTLTLAKLENFCFNSLRSVKIQLKNSNQSKLSWHRLKNLTKNIRKCMKNFLRFQKTFRQPWVRLRVTCKRSKILTRFVKSSRSSSCCYQDALMCFTPNLSYSSNGAKKSMSVLSLQDIQKISSKR